MHAQNATNQIDKFRNVVARETEIVTVQIAEQHGAARPSMPIAFQKLKETRRRKRRVQFDAPRQLGRRHDAPRMKELFHEQRSFDAIAANQLRADVTLQRGERVYEIAELCLHSFARRDRSVDSVNHCDRATTPRAVTRRERIAEAHRSQFQRSLFEHQLLVVLAIQPRLRVVVARRDNQHCEQRRSQKHRH